MKCFFYTSICLSLILSILISDILSCIYLSLKYYKSIIEIKHQIDNSHPSFIKPICKIALPIAFTTYIKSGLSTIKTTIIPTSFILYGLSYNEALSIYGLINGTIFTLILFPFTFIQSFNALLLPKLSTYNPLTEKNKLKNISSKCLKLTLIFAIISCTILIVCAVPINKYLYPNLNILNYLKILSPIIIFIYLDNVIDSLLKSLNCQIIVMLINIVDLLTCILFIKFLIPIYGINGYIFILYFSEIFNFLTSYFCLKHKLHKNN